MHNRVNEKILFLPHYSRTKKISGLARSGERRGPFLLGVEKPARTGERAPRDEIWPNSKSERYDFFFLSPTHRKTSIRPEKAAKSTLTQRRSASLVRVRAPKNVPGLRFNVKIGTKNLFNRKEGRFALSWPGLKHYLGLAHD